MATKQGTANEFAALLGAAAMATVLDIESTKYAQQDPEAAEVNCWVYGERPSRSRMYAVSIPVTAALAAWALYIKAAYLKSASPDDPKNRWAWRLPLLGLAVGHGVAAAANFMNFRKTVRPSAEK